MANPTGASTKMAALPISPSKERLPYDLGNPFPKMSIPNGKRCPSQKATSSIPLEIIDTYGTDAMRMALCASATHARQIDLDRRRFEEFKNFANKIWNGARFVFSNIEDLNRRDFARGIDSRSSLWKIAGSSRLLNRTVRDVNHHLSTYAFDKAANIVLMTSSGKNSAPIMSSSQTDPLWQSGHC